MGGIRVKRIFALLIITAMLPLNAFAANKVPAAPAGLALMSKNSTAASVIWKQVSETDGLIAYDIYNGTEKIGSSAARAGSIFPIYTVTNLEPDKVYVFRVAAVYSDGRMSRMSKPLAVRTLKAGSEQNVALGKKVEVSSVLTEETYPESLVDGCFRVITTQTGRQLRNRWSSGWKNVTEWAMVDLLEPVYVNKIILRHEGATVTANEGVNLNTFVIEGSNDKENWTQLASAEGNVSPVTEHDIKTDMFFRFYRVYITKYNSAAGDAANMARLSEIEIYNDTSRTVSQEDMDSIDYLEPPEIGTEMPRRYPPRVAAAAFNTSKITVDGIADEEVWSNAESYDDFICVWGSSDSKISFKALWDSENLYFFANIKDKFLICDSGEASYWDDDSLEIYLDGNMGRTTTYEKDDAQFVFMYGSPACAVKIGDVSAAYYTEPPHNIESAQKKTEDGWDIEVKIPLALIGISGEENKQIGLSVGYSDDLDGGTREAQFRWEGTTSNHISTEAFGTLVLGK